MNYNLSTFYPYIYKEKFKNRKLLHIDSGWICNNQNVYLDLDDLNIVDDLGHILDFYRKINIEGSVIRIRLLEETVLTNGCIYDEQLCNRCQIQNNEPMIGRICLNCYHDVKGSISGDIVYTKPVIHRFNLYEWIPIGGFLENRNINSHLYKRLLCIKYVGECIELELMDQSIDIDDPNAIINNTIYRILSINKVPSALESKILNLLSKPSRKFPEYRKLYTNLKSIMIG